MAGHKLLVWQRAVQMGMPATTQTTGTANRIGGTTYVNATSTTYGGGVGTFSCTRILEIRDDRVVAWQWGGNNCPFLEMGPYSNWRRR